MGFNDTWIQWIYECLSTARISVLMNRSPSGPFHVKSHVRQGCSLSPFLFLMAVEGLKCILDMEKEMDLIDGIFIYNSLPNVSFLEFVDNTLIFILADLQKLKNQKRVLMCF